LIGKSFRTSKKDQVPMPDGEIYVI